MSPGELRICEYNVENLFISLEYYDERDLDTVSEDEWKKFALAQFQRRQKSLAKTRGVAKSILDIDADILMLVEVGGEESLTHFNRYFLNDQYIPYFIPGNSRRSIDLAFLVKKDLPFQFAPRTNKEIAVEVETYTGKYTSKFSRDVAELRMSDGAELKLILLLTHLKSKISSDEDHKGTDVRTAEAKALANLYRALRSELPEVPIVIGGDFNAPLDSSEFDELNQTDVTDFYNVVQRPLDDRVTLVHFDYFGVAHPETLDYLLISPHLRGRVNDDQSYTYRYKGFYDIPNDLPHERKERYQMPSDHFPVVLTLRL